VNQQLGEASALDCLSSHLELSPVAPEYWYESGAYVRDNWQAARFARDMALDRTVTVVPHDIERYGRVVAEILLLDGNALNREIVRAGHAW
jgi:endonuclease YncB( thermonuclease family)